MRRAAPSRPHDPILPLVDVAFFLLVFALLAGRMDATAPFEVEPPRSALGATLPQGGATVAVAADGALALDGAPATREAILEALGGARFVRVNSDARAPVGAFLPLVAALEAAGAAEVALVVTPP
jgi:biopolymer transport protein ExbD